MPTVGWPPRPLCSGMVFVEMVHQTSVSRLIVASQLHKAAPTLVLLAKLLQTRMLLIIPKKKPRILNWPILSSKLSGHSRSKLVDTCSGNFNKPPRPGRFALWPLNLELILEETQSNGLTLHGGSVTRNV